MFALSRCRSLAGTGQHFARLAGFHAPAVFKGAFEVSQADNPSKVRLLFAREVVSYIRERVWHPAQRMRQRRDGALELRLQTSTRKELTRWILAWMTSGWNRGLDSTGIAGAFTQRPAEGAMLGL